jgi:hypothetical protein
VLLGPHGAADSLAEYLRVLGEWEANGWRWERWWGHAPEPEPE